MTPGDFTAFERGGRGGQERVASHRNRRGSGMRRLANETHHVPLETKGSEDHAGRPVHRFEDGSLLDVRFEVRVCIDAREFLPGVEHRVERHTVVAQRVLESRTLGIAQLSYLANIESAGG